MQPLPEHGPCLVCGSSNPGNIGMQWFVADDKSIVGSIALTERHQGPPSFAHGGAIAALLDEAMGSAGMQLGYHPALANLNIDYQRPIPLGEEITIQGRVDRQEGKRIWTEGLILLSDGTPAATAKGLYIEAGHIFAKFRYQDDKTEP